MKSITLNILLFILLLMIAVVSASWIGLCVGNGVSDHSEEQNEQEPEFIGGLIGCLDKDSNEPEPEKQLTQDTL